MEKHKANLQGFGGFSDDANGNFDTFEHEDGDQKDQHIKGDEDVGCNSPILHIVLLGIKACLADVLIQIDGLFAHASILQHRGELIRI